MSLPGLLPVMMLKRRASAPKRSIISMGSTPLPADLDIFLPCGSRMRPWMSTVWKGIWCICSQAEKIMRATQKKMMS